WRRWSAGRSGAVSRASRPTGFRSWSSTRTWTRSRGWPITTTSSKRAEWCGAAHRPSCARAPTSSIAISASSSEGASTAPSEASPRKGLRRQSRRSKVVIQSGDPMSWIDAGFPKTATPTSLVGRVLGLNPGMMTGPGTNTYLIGRRDPILIDTGAGVAEYLPLFEQYLAERGWAQPSRVVLTHRHRDHLGGVDDLRR